MKTLLPFVVLSLISSLGLSQAVVAAFNHNTNIADTYQSTCVGTDGSFYAASAYDSNHTFQGETIEMLNPDAHQEVLVIKYLNDGTVDWKHRITITSNNSSVGKIEFMAVDANGYLYLSTQGTSGNQFLKIENDSLAFSGVGNRVIQLYPNGKLRSYRSFNNQIHNLCAHGDHIYVNGLTNFSGPHIAKYDTLFTDPVWISQGSNSFFLGASSFDRIQMNNSPSGEYIAFLTIEAGQALEWEGNTIASGTTANFDELVAVVIDSTGAFQYSKTFYGADPLNTTAENPLSVAIDDDANLYFGCYTTGATNIAGIDFGPEVGYSANHSLIVKVNNLGLEEWAVQCSAASTAPRFEGLNIDLDGNLLFAGSGGGDIKINDDIVLSLSQRQPFAGKLNSAGQLIWIVGATEVENNCRFFRIYPLETNRYIVSALGFQSSTFQCQEEISGDFNQNHFLALIDALEAQPISASPSSEANFLVVNFQSNATNGFQYEWNFGDGNSSNEVDPSHTYLSAGSYNITLTVSNCQFTEVYEFEIEVEQEIIESVSALNATTFNAFFNSENSIQLKGDSIGNITIYDSLGKILISRNNVSIPTVLDIPQLSNGVYQILFRSGNSINSIKIIYNY